MMRFSKVVAASCIAKTIAHTKSVTTLPPTENEFMSESWESMLKEAEETEVPASFSIKDVMSTACDVFGAEIGAFAAAAAVAFVLRKPMKGKKKASFEPQASAPANSRTRNEKARSEGPVRRRSEALPAPEPKTPQREAARLLDDIVDAVKANGNVRAANHALELYQEMRCLLKQGDSVLAEATWHSRHSAFDLYSCLAQSSVRSSQAHLVLRLLDDMVAHSVARPLSFYESIMKQLAGQKHYQIALNVYDSLAKDGLTPSVITCSCLVSFATEVGEYDRAIELFDQLAAQSTPSIRAYMTILRVHNKRQDFASSLRLFRQMQQKDATIDSLVLNMILSTGVAADKVEEVNALVLEGAAATPKMVDTVSYNTLVKGFLQRNDLCSATECLERMQADGIKPNCITFNTMLEKAVRTCQDDKAWSLYKQMCEASVKPDKVTCSILIKGLGRRPAKAHLESAVALLEQASSTCDDAYIRNLKSIVSDAAARVAQR